MYIIVTKLVDKDQIKVIRSNRYDCIQNLIYYAKCDFYKYRTIMEQLSILSESGGTNVFDTVYEKDIVSIIQNILDTNINITKIKNQLVTIDNDLEIAIKNSIETYEMENMVNSISVVEYDNNIDNTNDNKDVEILDDNITVNTDEIDDITQMLIMKIKLYNEIDMKSSSIRKYFEYDGIDFYDIMSTENKIRCKIIYYLIIISKYWDISSINFASLIVVCDISYICMKDCNISDFMFSLYKFCKLLDMNYIISNSFQNNRDYFDVYAESRSECAGIYGHVIDYKYYESCKEFFRNLIMYIV